MSKGTKTTEQIRKKDEQLFDEVRKLQQNKSADYNRLYELSQKYIYKIIHDIVKDPYTTEDMMQETYLQIYNKINTLESAEAFYVWAGRIATNLTLRYIQKNRHEVPASADEEGSTDFVFDRVTDDTEDFIPEAVLVNREKQRLIGEILDSLSPEQKITVQFFYFEEMSVREIASAMKCSEGTVKSRLSYARKALKEAILDMEVKQGTRLYSLAALPLFWIVFREAVEKVSLAALTSAAAAAGGASAGNAGASGAAAAGGAAKAYGAGEAVATGGAASAASAGMAAGTAAGGTAAGTATAATGMALSAKIAIATVVSVVVVGGGGYGVYRATKAPEPEPILMEAEAPEETPASGTGTSAAEQVSYEVKPPEQTESISVEEVRQEYGDILSSYEELGLDESEIEALTEHIATAPADVRAYYAKMNGFSSVMAQLKQAYRNCLSADQYAQAERSILSEVDGMMAQQAVAMEQTIDFYEMYGGYEIVQRSMREQMQLVDVVSSLSSAGYQLLSHPLAKEAMSHFSAAEVASYLSQGVNVPSMVIMWCNENNDDGKYNDLVPYAEQLNNATMQWMSSLESVTSTATDPEYLKIYMAYYKNASPEKKAYINKLSEAMLKYLQ
ncbi:MAG: sigma-70 family RNA polymerase sigma factor [Lachnospiraceae bacterium]|nr:sigma-70 family RNA polymerase sigma factor [Lachnospiraceae bacterium]